MPLSEEQQLKMAQKRVQIIESAAQLFAHTGYEGTTIKKISQAAGVSFGSVFTYFKDKEQLFLSVVKEPLQTLSIELLDFNPQADEPLQELKEMVTKHIHVFAGMQDYLTLVVQVVGQSKRFPEAFEVLDQFHDTLISQIMKLIQNGQQKQILAMQDPFATATLYTSLLIGVRLNNTDTRFSQLWDSYIPPAIQIFGPISK